VNQYPRANSRERLKLILGRPQGSSPNYVLLERGGDPRETHVEARTPVDMPLRGNQRVPLSGGRRKPVTSYARAITIKKKKKKEGLAKKIVNSIRTKNGSAVMGENLSFQLYQRDIAFQWEKRAEGPAASRTVQRKRRKLKNDQSVDKTRRKFLTINARSGGWKYTRETKGRRIGNKKTKHTHHNPSGQTYGKRKELLHQ